MPTRILRSLKSAPSLGALLLLVSVSLFACSEEDSPTAVTDPWTLAEAWPDVDGNYWAFDVTYRWFHTDGSDVGMDYAPTEQSVPPPADAPAHYRDLHTPTDQVFDGESHPRFGLGFDGDMIGPDDQTYRVLRVGGEGPFGLVGGGGDDVLAWRRTDAAVTIADADHLDWQDPRFVLRTPLRVGESFATHNPPIQDLIDDSYGRVFALETFEVGARSFEECLVCLYVITSRGTVIDSAGMELGWVRMTNACLVVFARGIGPVYAIDRFRLGPLGEEGRILEEAVYEIVEWGNLQADS